VHKSRKLLGIEDNAYIRSGAFQLARYPLRDLSTLHERKGSYNADKPATKFLVLASRCLNAESDLDLRVPFPSRSPDSGARQIYKLLSPANTTDHCFRVLSSRSNERRAWEERQAGRNNRERELILNPSMR
jgi:hypothetical protein